MESEKGDAVFYHVAAALLCLLALSVCLSFVDLGRFNFAAALGIAAAKAALVAYFFMELGESVDAVRFMATASLAWLALLLGGTLSDLITRR